MSLPSNLIYSTAYSAWGPTICASALLALFCAYKLAVLVHAELTSPLRDLAGPPSESLIFGSFRELFRGDSTLVQEKWTREYGSTFMYRGLLGTSRMYTTDLKAINHILTNVNDYPKPEAAVYNIQRVVGKGVLLVEGDVHRKQRKLLNPAFGPQQIRELTEVFVEKSIELRDAWAEEITKHQEQNSDSPAQIEVLSWLSRMTLDVIGLAGFNYKFDSLAKSEDENELSAAFAKMFKTTAGMNVIAALRGLIPPLRFLPARGDKEVALASGTMRKIGGQLLAQSRAAIQKTEAGKSGKSARDILSILVRANAMDDLPESQRLSDEDVLAQIPTFLVAGHETTSVGTTWALYALTQNKDSQDKLRSELASVSTDNPTMDELNSLPYLDAVVRETLRLHAPVAATMRCALKDDIIPFAEPFTDKYGRKRESILIKKGQTLLIPILPINRRRDIWGEDATQFNPERWNNIPDAVSAIPGVWGNMMTFIGGPKACIGYRFSIVEMKALLFTLIRAFEFDLAVPATDIGVKTSITSRPVLLSADEKDENQMPLLVKFVNA